MRWIDERAAMAHELGAARFLLEHFMAGTANAHVRREAQAWLDRARGAELAGSNQTGSVSGLAGSGQSRRPDESGQSGSGGRTASPFERLGE